MAGQEIYYDQYWSGWAGSWERPIHPDLEALLRHNLHAGAEVLDLGCGDGTAYQSLVASMVRSYLGVDISSVAVESAKAHGLNAIQIDDANNLPFENGRFDTCLAFEVLEHLWEPHLALRELLRVLKPGGQVLATVPNVVSWRHRLDILFLGRFNPGGHPTLSAKEPWHDPHVRFFTRATLARMAESEGATNVQVGAAGFSMFGQLPFVKRRGASERMSEPFRPLQRRFPSLLGALLVLRARKPLLTRP